MQEFFIGILDTHHQGYVKHKLEDILVMVMCAVLSGLDELYQIVQFAQSKREFFKENFGIDKIPSKPTFSRILSMIDGKEVAEAILKLMQEKVTGEEEIIAVDGKAVRAAAEKDKPHSALQIITAYLTQTGITPGQEKIHEKTNEIPVFREMLSYLNVKGKIITADALHCQRETCKIIVDKKGDYVFGLKKRKILEGEIFFISVDKNLFLYDLSVVAIMKNEGNYAKEWLDYHLLAGVNHFYIFDNESPDNLKEVLQPYIEKNLVTYIFYPGKARQYEAYNEAAQKFKFESRYMAFIDADEFIFPQTNQSIVEILDEIFSDKKNVGGLGVNIFNFGSNFQEKADYSKGVLERFTRRNSVEDTPLLNNIHVGVAQIKSVTNPRKIDYFYNPHFAVYFEGFTAINSKGNPISHFSSYPPTIEKIVMNHYRDKSHEEYIKNKVQRGTADAVHNIYKEDGYTHETSANEVFDDSILKYRNERKKIFGVNDKNILEIFAEKNKINYDKIFQALFQNLFPIFAKNVSQEFLKGKLETFLTCLKASEFLRGKILNETSGKFFEEISLQAVYCTFQNEITIAELKLLIAEMPRILKFKYPTVDEIRKGLIRMLPQLMDLYRVYDPLAWKKFVNYKYLLEMLKIFDKV